MDIIESTINVKSDTYQKNYQEMTSLVTELEKELHKANHDRSEKSLARHKESGKLPALKKLELLLDRNTPFMEISPLAAKDMYGGKIHKAGLIIGVVVISGRECVISINDATIKGGSMYPLSVKKTLRCQAIAMENRLPLVSLMDSAGAYLPLQSEIFPDIDDGGRIFYNQARMSKMGIHQIVGAMGLCTAGGAYGVAMCDEIVHVKDHGAIFLGGPPLVKAATGEEVSPNDLGGAEVHCTESGVSDYYADNDVHCIDIIRQIVSRLPENEKSQLTMAQPEDPLYDPKELYGIVSPDLTQPYDIRQVIARIVDGSKFLEFKEMYGETLVTGFANIHGYPVGILANNGILFSQSAQKGTQFIQLCDRRKIPLVFLQNINGFIVGSAYEKAGITKDGHKMVNAVANATVPKFTMIVGASFGAGNYAMCGRAYSPRFLWMWPNAQIGVMGGAQAADVLITITDDQRKTSGQDPMTEDEKEFIRKPVMETALKEGNAYYATSQIWDDGIIDPVKSRDILGLAISASLNAPLRFEEYGYGVFRM